MRRTVTYQAPTGTANVAAAANSGLSAARRRRAGRISATSTATAPAGSSAMLDALVTIASPIAAPSPTAPQSVTPRRISRAPSHSAAAQVAYSIESGFTLDDMKLSIGHSPTVAAASSWRRGARPNTSPASSHAAVVVSSSQNTEKIRIR